MLYIPKLRIFIIIYFTNKSNTNTNYSTLILKIINSFAYQVNAQLLSSIRFPALTKHRKFIKRKKKKKLIKMKTLGTTKMQPNNNNKIKLLNSIIPSTRECSKISSQKEISSYFTQFFRLGHEFFIPKAKYIPFVCIYAMNYLNFSKFIV